MKCKMIFMFFMGVVPFVAMGQDWLSKLCDTSWKVRHDAVQQVTDQLTMATKNERDVMTSDVVELIESGSLDKQFQGGLHMAVNVLGALKSDLAVPCLVRHLSFLPSSYFTSELIPTEMYYPAAVALRKIGGESVVCAMNALLDDQAADDIKTRLALWVLCETTEREKVADWLAGQERLRRLSTGETLLELMPTVGQVMEPPFQLQEWDFGAAAFEPHSGVQDFLKRLVAERIAGEDDPFAWKVDPGTEEAEVPDSLEMADRMFRKCIVNIAGNLPGLCSLLGDLAWFGSHATTPEEAEAPFVVMSWADIPPDVFVVALKPHLKSRNPNMAAFAAQWLEKVSAEQKMQDKGL